jgi:glucose/arabinose dehydrogenase
VQQPSTGYTTSAPGRQCHANAARSPPIETRIPDAHRKKCRGNDALGEPRMRWLLRVGFLLSTATPTSMPAGAQLTHGQKPRLPAPFETKSSGNGPSGVKPPAGFLPTVPAGFHVSVFAKGFKYPRFLATATNGDIFLADLGAGQIVVLRSPLQPGEEAHREIFAEKLNRPFGIAFHEDYVYVGNMNEVVRFRYDKQTSKRTGEAEHLLDLPSGGGHVTRTVAFSSDGRKLYVSVGSASNIDIEKDQRRGAIQVCNPDGKNARLYATGLRNAVGIASGPASTNAMNWEITCRLISSLQ